MHVYQDQTGALSLDQLGMTLLGTVIYIFYAVIAFAVFPLIVPFGGLKKYPPEKQRQVLFSLTALVMFILGIAYVIFAGEGTSEGFAGRIHTRYLFPFAPLFWSFCLDKSVRGIKLNLPMFILLLYSAIVLACSGFSSIVSARWAPVDSIWLSHIIHDTTDIDCKLISQFAYLFLIGLGNWLLSRVGWRKGLKWVCGVFIALTLTLANIAGYDLNEHSNDSTLSSDAAYMSELLLEHENPLLLTTEMKYFDNYLSVLDIAMRNQPYFLQTENLCENLGDYGVFTPFKPKKYWTEDPINEVPVPSIVVIPAYQASKMRFVNDSRIESSPTGKYTIIYPNDNGQFIDSCLVGVKDGVAYGSAAIWVYNSHILSSSYLTVVLYITGSGSLTLSFGGQEETLNEYHISNSQSSSYVSHTFNIPPGTKTGCVSIKNVQGDMKITGYLLN